MASNQTHSDLFDILDDVVEDNMNEKEKWNRMKEDFYLAYKFNPIYDNMQDVNEEFIDIIRTKVNNDDNNEQNLSQELSQLSTGINDKNDEVKLMSIDRKRQRQELSPQSSFTSTKETIVKKIRTVTEENIMPEYLLSKNQLFDIMIQNRIHFTRTIKTDDLRQMAFYLHQISYYKQLYKLWSIYLQAGRGILKQEQEGQEYIDRRYWSIEVQSILETKANIDQTIITDEEKHIVYQTIVEEQLQEYQEKIQFYEDQWNQKKIVLSDWTLDIESFVQQYGLVPLQMKYDYQQKILMYDYEDHLLECQYQQQQPTIYQKHRAQYLYNLEYQLETVKYQLIEYRERLRFNKPPIVYDPLEISFPMNSLHTVSNSHQISYEKLIQQTKLQLITLHLIVLEIKVHEYQKQFKQEIDTMWHNYSHPVENQVMTKVLIQLITERSKRMIEKFKLMHEFTLNYSIRNSYEQLLEINFKRIGFISTLVMDTTALKNKYSFTEAQLKLLNRGPCYIIPGQLRSSTSSIEAIDTVVKKQYAPLKHQLALFFDKYKINLSRQNYFNIETWKDFQRCYSIPLPIEIEQRAQYEKKLIESIQSNLETQHLILRRTADQKNLFYLGSVAEFTKLCHEFMETNTEYTIIFNIDKMKKDDIQIELNKKYQFINQELEKLYNTKKLNETVFHRLRLNINQLQMSYLYFLPNYSMDNILQVQPFIQIHPRRSSTGKIAHFIYHLLRPYIFDIIKPTLFQNDADFIAKFNDYIYNERHPLQPTTLFVTIKITNFYHLVSHSTIIAQLDYFFMDYSKINKFSCLSNTTDKLQYLSMNTIQELIRLVLENTFFYYNENIYGFTRGGPRNFLLNELLSNMYLFVWQKVFFQRHRDFQTTEFYGRFNDQLFFTWNQTKEELDSFLQLMYAYDSNIQFETCINKSVSFLNIQIQNNHGQLYTSIQTSKYILPYTVEHPQLDHKRWFQFALIHAICCCSQWLDFIHEQMNIQIACLRHGYSIDFIETQLKQFCIYFKAEHIRYCFNQTNYEEVRHRLFNFIIEQHQRMNKDVKLADNNQIVHFYYPYDYGPYQQFYRKFLEHWSTYIKDDSKLSNQEIKITLNTKHIYSLKTLLTREKPWDERFKEFEN